VIVRHGPRPALETGFPQIWKACAATREQWQSARQYEDWTRVPLYKAEDFHRDVVERPPLRIDFGGRIGCVLLVGSHQPFGRSQEQRVNEALEKFERITLEGMVEGRKIETVPVLIRVTDALSSSAAYERAVRALCETEIAIFDITGLERAIMLFLGIR